ncbi:Uncharacterized protein FKW44_004835 [Caligus rogercresseyi]|uniref:Uncharacterized protein n=1 Tax=Caligus rogercresseyi TaxID=217165 RepID=A0A7T8KAS5_CALRO|nr:Uncharacterized protein FKW44_004835 [Caligus rogercresseyi]
MKALSKIGLTSHKKEERDEAASLKRAMEKFSFSHETDLSIAVQLLDCAIADLSAYREHFEESKQAAQGLSEKWGVSKAFENTRARKVKAHFDELSQDERLADADSYFRVHVFNACLDIVISQLTQRFTGLRSTAERFKAIQPMTLCTARRRTVSASKQTGRHLQR